MNQSSIAIDRPRRTSYYMLEEHPALLSTIYSDLGEIDDQQSAALEHVL
jgi:hypothetical protein